MRIFYLSDGASVHTKKWVISLLKLGHTIHLYSLHTFDSAIYEPFKEQFSYTIHNLNKQKTKWGGINKVSYFKVIPEIKKIIRSFNPDIVHSHFASSYGLLGAKTGFHPFIISTWGSDVFEFPLRSAIHKNILKNNFSKADRILSTSYVMATEANKYTKKAIEVTPFGIDINVFKANKSIKKSTITPFSDTDILIGTAKALEDKYAIDHLIRAFTILEKKYPELPLKLCIVGKGSAENKLKKLTENLNIKDKVYFAGQIDHTIIPDYLNCLDVFVALSLEESFGVAVIEAGACEKAVVVSDEGGLPEVVDDGVTGFIVSKGDITLAAEKIEKLINDPNLRNSLGRAGRLRVKKLYNWQVCVKQMEDIYKEVLCNSDGKKGT